MPALVLFGRRWNIASDDFFFPALYDVISSVAWFSALVIIFVQNEASLNCKDGFYIKGYVFLNFVILPMMITLGVWLIYTTTRGRMFETKRRRLVRPILYLRISVGLCSFLVNILGLVWFFVREFGCAQAVTAKQFIIWFIVIHLIHTFLFILIISLFVFDPLGREYLKIHGTSPDNVENGEPIIELPVTRRSRYTEWRMKWWMHFLYICCNASLPITDQTSVVVEEIAKIWTYLAGDYDFVPTDILAGFGGLNLKLIGKKIPIHPVGITFANLKAAIQTEVPISDKSLKLWLLELRKVEDVYEFFRLYKYIDLTSALHLGRKVNCNCCCGRRQSTAIVEGDDIFDSCIKVMESYMSELKITASSLIFVSFVNDYYVTPFFMTVGERDNSGKVYILAFRGYGSAVDLMTYFSAWPVSLDGIPDHTNFLVHHGALLAARNAKATLDRFGLLDQIRQSSASADELPKKLILTGHSLGAAIAVVLGIILRSEFPDLKVYAYNPPGGLLNEPASQYTRDFVTSIVMGSDFVSRLSITAFEQFVEELVSEFKKSDRPKYLSQIKQCIHTFCPCRGKDSNKGDKNQNETPIQIVDENSWRPRKPIPQMELPGLILHVIPKNLNYIKAGKLDFNNFTVDSRNPKFEMRWVMPNQLHRIEISEGMFEGHEPVHALKAIYEYLVLMQLQVIELKFEEQDELIIEMSIPKAPPPTPKDPSQPDTDLASITIVEPKVEDIASLIRKLDKGNKIK